MTSFRFQARRALLTYPQCTMNIQELYECINTKCPVKWARICIEQHQDGSPHLHAAVEFKKKLTTKRQDYFDFNGFHPNIQAAKNWPATQNYVKKGNNWEDFNNNENESDDEFDLYEMAETHSSREFFEQCRKAKVPYAYAQQAWRSRSSIFNLTESIPNGATIREDLGQITIDEEERTSVVIIGPSGIGKTTWAKRNCKKPALFVTHLDGLRNLRTEHQCIVFDDMDFRHLPRNTQIFIADRDEPRAIHVRYGVAEIPAGIQKIFTGNQPVFDSTDEAINRRLRRINLY